ncbi:MAG: phosphate signaling complex protein PhoU [Methylococcaceae bacterium]|nr:MAG: phosphate signaling complex protein PhoU [Methylococcaceae bacterium]
MASLFDKEDIQHHISKQFDQELVDIHSRILAMGGLVEEQVAAGVKSLIDADAELAERVVADDVKINSLEVSIDEECTQILARRQPTARDLRLVMAVIKTITDLERIGDEAKRIAFHAMDLSKQFPKRNQFSDLEHLASHVSDMLSDALDAFARMDVEQALRVVQDDKVANKEYESILRQQITYMMEDPRSIHVCLDIMWSARSLERIGDRACNICEYVIYYVMGKDIRHISLEEAQREIKGG